MSAFIAQKTADRVYLLTDGGAWHQDGRLHFTFEKVWRSDVAPLAVTARSSCDRAMAAAETVLALAQCGSFDGTLMLMERLLAKCRRVAAERAGEPDLAPLQCVIVGVSETSGPQIRYYNSVNSALPGSGGHFEPWTLIDPGQAINGLPVITQEDLAAVGITAADLASEHVTRDRGADLFEAARKIVPDPFFKGEPHVMVGGFCDLTTVTADGAVTNRLRTWPDKEGKRILPRASARVQPIATGMNRQQRRAAEKQRQVA